MPKKKKKEEKSVTSDLQQFYKLSQVAEALNVSTKTIKKLIDQGKITAVQLGKKSTRISKDEYERITKEGIEFTEDEEK